MIYSQTFLSYLFSVLLGLFIFFRLTFFFKDYFEKIFSVTIATAVVLHPLTIDAFTGPNTLAGPLAFAFILEGLFFLKKEHIKTGLFFLCLGSLCNIAYILLPLYFFILHWNKIREYTYVGGIYLLLISIYLFKHRLHGHHQPHIFLTYFIQNIFAPLTLNIFSFSLFNFSWFSTVFTIMIFCLFFMKLRKEKDVYLFLPFIFLPCVGVLYHPWQQKYEFWHEIILSSSSYYSIVFGMTALLAFCIPKKFFIGWSFFILIISFLWGIQWREISGLIEVSLNNLPPNFTEMVEAKRLLAWEFLFEHKNERGLSILQGLARENPRNFEIQSDLKLIDEKK